MSLFHSVLRTVFRCAHACLPRFYSNSLLRYLQPLLRAEILNILLRLPPTGLYGSNPCLLTFKNFCEHAKEALFGAPRAVTQRRIEKEIRETMVDNAEVRWLMDALDVDFSELHFLTLVEKYEAVCPGKLHDRYQRLMNVWNGNVMTNGKVAEIRAGKVRKKLLKEPELERVDLEAQVELEVQQIVDAYHRKRADAYAEAQEVLQEMEQHDQYLFYRRVQKVWQESGLQRLHRLYLDLDRSVGLGRQSRGQHFETKADTVFRLVLSDLRQYLREGGVLSVDALCFERATQAEWKGEDNKHIGEADVVIYCYYPTLPIVGEQKPGKEEQESERGATASDVDPCMCEQGCVLCDGSSMSMTVTRRGCRYRAVLIGIVEMKANCFELGAGLRQQQGKLLLRGASLHCSSTEVFHFRSDSTTQCSTPVFLATLIPDHDYMYGTHTHISIY